MNMFRKYVALFFLCVAVATGVQANDSTARVGIGGLELTKTDAIRMVEEVLEISQKEIRVRYVYRNESAADVTTVVAFPMPRFGWNPKEAATDGNVGPLKGFQTRVNDAPVKSQIQLRAYLKNKDITDQLGLAGVHDGWIRSALSCNISQVQDKECLDEKLNRRIPGVVANGEPQYQAQETAWWEQTFPKGQTVVVEHAYKPKVGQIYSPFNGNEKDLGTFSPATLGVNERSESPRRACMHEGGFASLMARVKRVAEKGDPLWST